VAGTFTVNETLQVASKRRLSRSVWLLNLLDSITVTSIRSLLLTPRRAARVFVTDSLTSCAVTPPATTHICPSTDSARAGIGAFGALSSAGALAVVEDESIASAQEFLLT